MRKPNNEPPSNPGRFTTTTTSEIGTAGVERLGVEAEGVGAGVGRGDLDWSAAA
jgi:hypothetical protein